MFQFVDQHQFYLPLDIDFLVDTMKNNMDDLARNWRMMGRPTCICPVSTSMLGGTITITLTKLTCSLILWL